MSRPTREVGREGSEEGLMRYIDSATSALPLSLRTHLW